MSTAADKLHADIAKGCAGYIAFLKVDSPIVSRSHYYLRELYATYGNELVDVELNRQFARIKHTSC